MPPRFPLCRVCWFVALAALIAVGVPYIGHPSLAIPLRDRGRDSSVNSILQHTLGEPNLADRLTQWLHDLPPGEAVLVLAPPEQMDAALTANLISYLAWPRPVYVSAEPDRSRQLMQNYRDRYAAVGLCYLTPPPGLKIDKSFSPALGFITVDKPNAALPPQPL